MTLGSNIGQPTKLTLPAGWVAEPIGLDCRSRPIVPTGA